MPADVSGIKWDTFILYSFGRCDLLQFQETVHIYAIGENKVDIMHVYVYGGLNYDVNIVGNCATNCEFQLQLAHLQL